MKYNGLSLYKVSDKGYILVLDAATAGLDLPAEGKALVLLRQEANFAKL